MARVAVITAALVRLTWRDLRSLGSIAGNNLFFCLLLMLHGQPSSGLFLLLLIAVPLLLLVSGDAFAQIPSDRLALWPLSRAEGITLRLAALLLNPLLWVAIGVWLFSRQFAWALLLLALLAASQLLAAAFSRLGAKFARRSLWTTIPSGHTWLTILLAKNLRQLLSTLDPYPLIPLSLGAIIYKFTAPHPDPSASTVISVLAAIGFSTFAQSLFGLDGRSGRDRYRLLPLRGWQILLAKDLAVLSVLLLLVLLLRPDVGFAAGLLTLTIGHHSSVLQPLPQQRWRFTSGRIWPLGLIQVAATISVGMAVVQSEQWLVLALAVYAGSLLVYGKIWDRA